jgi:predicted nucleotidyltransferase
VAIYRFGSTAHGTASGASDTDIAVLATSRIPAALRFDLQEQLAAHLGCGVDLVDLAVASSWRSRPRQDAIILNLQRACESSIDAAMHLVRVHRLGTKRETRATAGFWSAPPAGLAGD